MTRPILKNPDARRLFLDRHALAEAPAGPATGGHLARLIDRIGFVQLDSINTVERAHHMILWSRRQSYRPEALHKLIEKDRLLWEHWTHDASILPIQLHGHWHHRFESDEVRLRKNWPKWFRPGYEAQFDTILRRIEAEGPLTTSDVGEGEERGKGGWWDWHPSKTALEWLWRTGQLAITRRESFRKVYDLSHRVIPDLHRTPLGDRAAMVDWSCNAALDRLGFADVSELRAFWHLITPEEAKAWAATALKRGDVVPVEIEGANGSRKRSLARPDVLQAAAAAPEPTNRVRILSPFDPALRDRDRAEFLFGFFYRIEVFVPEPQRKYGYYVFPVLEGARLIGRIDAKAFRDANTLRIRAYWPEAGVAMGTGRLQRLEAEVHRLASFAGCDRVAFNDGWLREALASD
jgi:uncharacterized protein YcaQ